MQPDLVGYLLGALDLDECAQIERQLRLDPALREALETARASLAPLEHDRMNWDPPADLASRTCRMVELLGAAAEEPTLSPKAPAQRPIPRRPAPLEAPLPPAGSWGFSDVAMAAGVLILAALVIVPALSNGRAQTLAETCRDRLRAFGVAHQYYVQTFGQVPLIDSDPLTRSPLEHVALLRDVGYLDATQAMCPAAFHKLPEVPSVRLPSLDELSSLGSQGLRKAAVDFPALYSVAVAYYVDGPRYDLPDDWEAENFPVAGDAVDRAVGGSSTNHSGGQNVLRCDGSVIYLDKPLRPLARDHIYTNFFGAVGLPAAPDDCILVNADDCPLNVRPFVIPTN